ncbi:hypothetical protein HYW46_06770 [Candidatus Daviesbacteria bacterium]|nr:hypothetical protein [Candidatus Daviesbacteria bacterium]
MISKFQISNFKFQISLFFLFTFSFLLFPLHAFASHCDASGNFTSLNSYCDPSTNTIWQDEVDCTHADTGTACAIPAPATCLYNETCDAGPGPASGEHTCTGTNPNEAGQPQCGYNSAVDPACTACTAKTPPAPPVPPPAPPAPPAGATPTAAIATESAEEAAIRHMDTGLKPEELPQEADEKPGIIQIIGDFFSNIGRLLNRMVSFFQNSQGLQTAELPEQNCKSSDPDSAVSNFLGDSDCKGIYNSTTPDEQILPNGIKVRVGNIDIPKTEQANAKEEGFEDAFLPEGCNKITTGDCNIPISP